MRGAWRWEMRLEWLPWEGWCEDGAREARRRLGVTRFQPCGAAAGLLVRVASPLSSWDLWGMVGCGLPLGGLLGSGGLALVSGLAEGVACGWWRHHALEGAGVAWNGELERKMEKF